MYGVVAAARRLGCPSYYLPPEPERSTLQSALSQIPVQPRPSFGFWSGYVPSAEYYREVYRGLQERGIYLLNAPEENRRLAEFDISYPFLRGLTPESVVLQSKDDAERCISQLGLPLFLKGAVFSRKGLGWGACVAQTPEELSKLIEALLPLPY